MVNVATQPSPELRTSKITTVVAGAAIILIVAVVLNVRVLYWMAGCLISVPIVSQLLQRLQAGGITAERWLPATGSVGETKTVRLILRNRTRWPRLLLTVQDELPAGLEADFGAGLAFQLRPRGTAEVSYQLRLARRGIYTLREARLQTVDLLNGPERSAPLPCPGEIVVYPRIVSLTHLTQPRSVGYSPQLAVSQPRRGQSSTPYGIRGYVRGDPLRQVHWRSTARRGELMVVERESEAAADLWIVVDARAEQNLGLGIHTTLECGLALAASLAAAALNRGENARLLIPGNPECGEAGRGKSALTAMLRQLAATEATEGGEFAEQARAGLEGRLPAGGQICLITAAPESGLLELMRDLRGQQSEPALYGLDGSTFEGAGVSAEWTALARQLRARKLSVNLLRRDEELTGRLLGLQPSGKWS